jgi:hypothetical protein
MALSEPPVVPAFNVKLTVPVGTLEDVVVSTTVAVQTDAPPGMIVLGLQTTLVEVKMSMIVSVIDAVGPLPRCVASPPYVPLTVAEPAATQVKVTVHVPVPPNVQLAATVPTAVFDDVNVTVPLGVMAVPTLVSVTVAVHVDAPPMLMLDGAQETLVDVDRLFTVIVFDVPMLLLWVESPP